jgi:cytochrome c553
MNKRAVWIALVAGCAVAILAGQTEQEFLAHNDLTSGSELFRMYCASCHGVDGRGDGPVAEALKTQTG